MEKKPFEFPDRGEWLYYQSPGTFSEEEQKRQYALIFLTRLCNYLNDGWEQYEDYYTYYDYSYPRYSTRYQNWEVSFIKNDSYMRDELLMFKDYDTTRQFLTYKGCGTDTITQLNILYNIK